MHTQPAHACFMPRRPVLTGAYGTVASLSPQPATVRTLPADTQEAGAAEALAVLAKATAAGEEAFLAALPEVEPRLISAGAQGQAVRLALEAGAYRAAQRLAEAAARHHPEDPALRRLASVLQPARVRAVPARDSEGVVLAVAWLKREGARYRGRWVALEQGELRASAGSYRELIAEIGPGRGFYVTKVG